MVEYYARVVYSQDYDPFASMSVTIAVILYPVAEDKDEEVMAAYGILSIRDDVDAAREVFEELASLFSEARFGMHRGIIKSAIHRGSSLRLESMTPEELVERLKEMGFDMRGTTLTYGQFLVVHAMTAWEKAKA